MSIPRVIDAPRSSAHADTGHRPPPLARVLWIWGPAIALMVAIFGASSIPDLQTSPAGLSDKTVHALVYGLLGALVLRAVTRAEWAGVTLVAALAATLISGLYGVTDELHQGFVPGRTTEALDMVADVVGASGAAGVIWAWSIIRASRWEQKVHPPRSPHPPL